MPILCMVCGRESQRISPAHVKTHSMTISQYREKYPDAPIISPELSVRLSEAQHEAQGSPEARAAMSAKLKAVPKTPEWNRRNSEGQKGKIIPADVRSKMSVSAKVRYAGGGNQINTPEMQDKIRAIQKTDKYKTALADGQARSYASTRFNGLNDRTAAILSALGLAFEREKVLGYARFDFAFPTAKVAIEVMGCRWHMCPDHPKFWINIDEAKVSRRRALDKSKRTYATDRGWTVIDLWEHAYPADDKDAGEWILGLLPPSVAKGMKLA